MKGFRANIGGGAQLALFALALQFALSFGHIHWLASQSSPVLNAATTLGQLIGLSAPAPQVRSDQSAPSDDRDQQAADSCAICSVMAMARTLLLSPAPALVLPAEVEFVPFATSGTFIRLASIGVAFQPRAPPAS
jgi:DUF2946 family protein